MAANEPKTLREAIVYFADPAKCRTYLAARRWPCGVTCPRCGSQNVLFLEKYNRWHCREKHAAPQFTLKTGTIMEDSHVGLDKWLTAMWLIVNCKNGVSSYEIARDLGVTQKTAWFLDHRIRLAMGLDPTGKFSGEVEADETFIGGKARDMLASERKRRITGPGPAYKTAVMGILERGSEKGHSQVHTAIFPDTRKKALQAEVKQHVEAGSALYTDALQSYYGLDEFEHQVHAVQYVDGKVHTNGMESFWSLLKRGINGTYVSVEPFHLFRYLGEQVYRYNNRKMTGSERFDLAVRGIAGKRLTFDELIGKVNRSLAALPC